MPAEKKELIRSTAVKVISDEGFYNATTDQIAKEAGISVGTIYNYFKNKEDILAYIFEKEMEKRLKFWEKIDQEIPIYKKLEKYVGFHFQEISEDIDLAHVLMREHNFPSKYVISSVDDFSKKSIQLLKQMLTKGIENGEIRELNDLDIVAATLFGALQGASQQFIKKIDNDKVYKGLKEEVIKLIWFSLKP